MNESDKDRDDHEAQAAPARADGATAVEAGAAASTGSTAVPLASSTLATEAADGSNTVSAPPGTHQTGEPGAQAMALPPQVIRFHIGGLAGSEATEGVADARAQSADGLFEPKLPWDPKSSHLVLPRVPAASGVSAAGSGSPSALRERDPVSVDANAPIALETAAGTCFTTAGRLNDRLLQSCGHPLSRGDGEIDLTPWATQAGTGDRTAPNILRLHVFEPPQGALQSPIGSLKAARDWADQLQKLETSSSPWLRRWTDPSGAPSAEAPSPRRAAPAQRALVFIPALGLDCHASFGQLLASEPEVWGELERHYGQPGGGSLSGEQLPPDIYAFDPPGFGASPLDHAVALLEALHEARLDNVPIDLVTLGSGGLVGDLLATTALPADFGRAAGGGGNSAWRRDVDGLGPAGSLEQPLDRRPARTDDADAAVDVPVTDFHRLLDQLAEAQEKQLAVITALKSQYRLGVRRYVRVAAPARGSRLATDSDLFLSLLLDEAMQVRHRISGGQREKLVNVALAVIASRHDPHLVPGLEPWLTDSPVARLLRSAKATRPQDTPPWMAIVAGDHRRGSPLLRMAALMTDDPIDGLEQDMLVDTPSMLGGIAESAQARVLFSQGSRIGHFRHFSELDVRLAVRDWLTCADTRQLVAFSELPREDDERDIDASQREQREARLVASGQSSKDDLPIVVVVPSLMGTHLAIEVGRAATRADEGARVAAGGSPGGLDRIWFDPRDIALGNIRRLGLRAQASGDAPKVIPEMLFGRYYRELMLYLAGSHRVEPFAYDWRMSHADAGRRLADRLDKLLKRWPQAPVRLLTHGTGALVLRAALVADPALAERLREREGSRLVMLAPPHQGSHAMVETLLGRSDSIRSIARLDREQTMREVLAQFGRCPGVLEVLPAPGFRDAYADAKLLDGQVVEPSRYHDAGHWKKLQEASCDAWFGARQAWTRDIPEAEVKPLLAAAGAFWAGLNGAGEAPKVCEGADAIGAAKAAPDAKPAGPTLPRLPAGFDADDFAIQVLGTGTLTPCGVVLCQAPGGGSARLRLLGTSDGDGTVTWASSRIDGVARTHFMPVEHGAMASTPAHFQALLDLLRTGRTANLETTPPVSALGGEQAPRLYDVAPPLMDDRDTLARGLMGAMAPSGLTLRRQRKLQVSVRAGDLRYVRSPLLVGHYQNDPIAGPEKLLDEEMLGGALTSRYLLGAYAGALSTATIVLQRQGGPRSGGTALSGAVITGLGRYDQPLHRSALTEAVRSGVLRFLLHAMDVLGQDHGGLKLSALLIGYSSAVNLEVADVVEALVRGTLQANAKFYQATGRRLHVSHLELVEIYVDTAIAAVYALRRLAPKLQDEAAREDDSMLICRHALKEGEGARPRLLATTQQNQWSRLTITSVSKAELDARMGIEGSAPASVQGAGTCAAMPAAIWEVARHAAMRFAYAGNRARADVTLRLQQPGLLQQLAARASASGDWSTEGRAFSRMLFQLLVPDAFKDIVRQIDRLILVLDGETAALPWEMLSESLGGDHAERPLAIRTPVVRQLLAHDPRRRIRPNDQRTALVIGGPSTERSARWFRGSAGVEAARLPDAAQEGREVESQLRRCEYETLRLGEEATFDVVLRELLASNHRLLHIAGHGVCDLIHVADGRRRSGVLLSDGFVLTAAEIDSMETVPELVFLNCCHLGITDPGDGTVPASGSLNRLAASLATGLIEIGVRCVVVAGWATDDALARRFAVDFYRALLEDNMTFGDAVLEARRRNWEVDKAHLSTTWGAFQAYGDAGWRVRAPAEGQPDSASPQAAPAELLDEVATLRVRATRRRRQLLADQGAQAQALRRALARAPSAWRGLPEVHSAVGAAWMDLQRFDEALASLERAVRSEGGRGQVPLRDLVRLAEVAIHHAAREERKESSDAHAPAAEDSPHGLAGVRRALQRLEHLDTIVGRDQSAHAGRLRLHLSLTAARARMGILANRALRTADKVQRGQLREALQEAVRDAASACGELASRSARGDANPLHLVNEIVMQGLAEAGDGVPSLQAHEAARLNRCQAAIANGFVGRHSLMGAVTARSWMLARAMFDGTLGRDDERARQFIEELTVASIEACDSVSATPAEFGAVLDHLRLVARVQEAMALDARSRAAVDWLHRSAGRLKLMCERIGPGFTSETMRE